MSRVRPPLPSRRLRRGMRTSYKDVTSRLVTRGPMKGTYRLPGNPRPSDYRAGPDGMHIVWSIGRSLRDQPGAPKGAVFAALDGRFYMNPDFECLWLR